MTSKMGKATWATAAAVLVLAATQATSPATAAPRDPVTVSHAGATELSAQRRTRITVRPRRAVLGPNSVRQCRAWLAQEFRPSGTVIVPRQQCWWN